MQHCVKRALRYTQISSVQPSRTARMLSSRVADTLSIAMSNDAVLKSMFLTSITRHSSDVRSLCFNFMASIAAGEKSILHGFVYRLRNKSWVRDWTRGLVNEVFSFNQSDSYVRSFHSLSATSSERLLQVGDIFRKIRRVDQMFETTRRAHRSPNLLCPQHRIVHPNIPQRQALL